MIHYINPEERLTIAKVKEIVDNKMTIALSEEAKHRIQKCRDYLNKKMESQKEPIYGVTTGFGSLCNISISKEQLSQLQKNLVMSHACGVGDEVPQEVVKLMLLLKAQNFCFGYSGAQLQTVQRLIDCYNNDVLPIVYQQGSLGASGDLCPLANLMLPAILGMGDVYYKGRRCDVKEVYAELGWQPIELQSKEGLALLNGSVHEQLCHLVHHQSPASEQAGRHASGPQPGCFRRSHRAFLREPPHGASAQRPVGDCCRRAQVY